MNKTIKKSINNLIEDIYQAPALKKFLNDFLKQEFQDSGKILSPKIYIVGGAVRDALMGKKSKDYDFVIEGLSKKQIADYLDNTKGKSLDIASRNFGVFKYKLPGSKTVIDIALPRQDIYTEHGKGHKDVITRAKKNLTIKDDLSRRDFTINAMAIEIGSQTVIDYYDGIGDINKKLIKCVGKPYDRLVLEDPTRIMRALRFASQLDFDIEKNTLKIIKKYHSEINKKFKHQYVTKKGIKKTKIAERVAREVLALEFIRGFDSDPAGYIALLDDLKIYRTLLTKDTAKIWENMKTTDQPKDMHAEGSVWNHSLISLENIKMLKNNKLGLLTNTSINLKLATFFHDIGKVTTLEIDESGKFTYYNHPDESAEIARKIIRHLKLFSATSKEDRLRVDIDRISYLIKHHMLPSASYAHEMKDKTIVKYFLEDEERGRELLQLAYIDASSSIKERGPQDYTGIKRTLKKIEEAKAKLAKIKKDKKVYPVDGKKIKELLAKVINKEKKNLAKTKYLELMSTATENRGGHLIGELKELILEDALENPEEYSTTRKKNARGAEIVKNMILS